MDSEKEPLAPPNYDSSTEGHHPPQPIPNAYQSYDSHIQMPQPGFQQSTYPGNQFPAQPGPYAANPGPYTPNAGPYAPNTAPYAPNAGPYAPNTAPYAPNTAPYAPNAGPYAPNTAPYAPNTAPFPPGAPFQPPNTGMYPGAYPTLPDITYPTLTLAQSNMVIETPVSCVKFLLWLFLTLLYIGIIIGIVVMFILNAVAFPRMLPYVVFVMFGIPLVLIVIRMLAFQFGQRINVPIQSLTRTQLENLPVEYQYLIAPSVQFVPLRTRGPPLTYFYMLIFYSIFSIIMTLFVGSILNMKEIMKFFIVGVSVAAAVSGIFVSVAAPITHLPFIGPRIRPRIAIY